jgi:glucose/arabinose dehydrogenase
MWDRDRLKKSTMPLTQAGINYGWRCYEGNNTYNTTGCAAQSTMTFPVAAYDHSGGKCSITGGYVYRGTQFPALQGRYFLQITALRRSEV